MKYIIKQKNRIECISRNGDYHGFFTIKNVDIVLSAKNPRDLDDTKFVSNNKSNILIPNFSLDIVVDGIFSETPLLLNNSSAIFLALIASSSP